MWHIVSFASGLDWKLHAKEDEKLPALLNEDGLTAGYRSPSVFNKARVVELSHYSPSPEFHIICPERYKAKADRLQA
jgi:hypothetical protein